MLKKRILILSLTGLSILLGQEQHDHHDEHGHHNELSIALGVTPGHDNENSKMGCTLH